MAYVCGDYEYELLPDGTAEIAYNGKEPHVVVPAKLDGHAVSSIRYYGFNWMDTLESVVLPEGLRKIGNFAFHHCEKLESVHIPQSVTQMGGNVFADCRSLTDVHLPEGMTQIPNGMFKGCIGLQKIGIPETITEIGDSAFFLCASLKEMVIPSSVTMIGMSAFAHCSKLRCITLPDSVQCMEAYVFDGCRELVINAARGSYAWEYAAENDIPTDSFVYGDYRCSVEIDGTVGVMRYLGREEVLDIPAAICGRAVSVIRSEAFESNLGLRWISLPEGVARIKRYAFARCEALEVVCIPASVMEIEEAALLSCHALSALEVAPENGAYTVVDGALYTRDMRMLVAWPQASGDVCVADGVQTIGAHAFALCKRLTGVKLPQSLERICVYAFNGCEALVDIDFPPSLQSVENFAFHQCDRLEGRQLPNGKKIKIC